MKLISILILPVLIITGCGNGKSKTVETATKEIKDSIPGCIKQRIDEIKRQPVWNPPAEVNEYTYNGKHVFLVTSDCCDQYIMLYDGSCNYICAPSGGIDGTGDGKCDDFDKKATFVKLIWKDSRK